MNQRFRILIIILLLVTIGYAQQTSFLDAKSLTSSITISPYQKEVAGTVRLSFDIIQKTDSIYLDAKNMTFKNVMLNGKKVPYNVTTKHLVINKNLKVSSGNTLTFEYKATPKQAMYFIDWDNDGRKQVWTQGQGKYTSYWLPSFDDMNEKLVFDLNITFDSNYEVVANGTLEKKEVQENTTTWYYDMEAPMSSYLVALAIGKYEKKELLSNSNIPLEFYYYPDNPETVVPTYSYGKEIFNYLEETIGVNYPWSNYKQVPVKDFLYAGMENTTLTIFSDSFLTDEIGYKDKNYVNVNAHELAHQWFGNLVTEKDSEHHWLHEGFATYYALRVERKIFGDDYYYNKLYNTYRQLLEAQKTDTIPLMHPKASSLTFYEKGAWALHILNEAIGDAAFQKSVQEFLTTYQYKNVTIDSFLKIVEKQTNFDIEEFKKSWLKSNKFPKDVAIKSLNKNTSTRLLLALDKRPLHETFDDINRRREKIFYGTLHEIFRKATTIEDSLYAKAIFREAFTSKDIKIRQGIALALQKIPKEFKTSYESLLQDNSYVTKEAALFNLWVNFPEERRQYLDLTHNVTGFRNKSFRILWITLALMTENYKRGNIKSYYNELINYTSPSYGFEVREQAFNYLLQINAYNDVAIKHLILATKHHNWRFKKDAERILNILKKDEKYSELVNTYLVE